MQLTPPLGIFGGTFDPIHNGHIFPVLEAAHKANIESVTLMPCYIPSHKDPAIVSSDHRLKMVELICNEYPLFHSDSRDINRGKPTYTLDSLQEIRESMPTTPLCFFIGTDSLQNLFTWHNWQALFSLCHFVVCERKGDSVEQLPHSQDNLLRLNRLLNKRQVFDPIDLHNSLSGNIYVANTQALTVSSSTIRNKLIENQSVENLLPSKILDYIQQHKLYQPGTNFC